MRNRRCASVHRFATTIFLLVLLALNQNLPGQINALSSGPQGFEDLARQATAAREQGHANEAVRFYQQALSLHPDSEEGWWYLGTILYDGNHWADARSAFAKVVELDPNLGPAWSFLGLCAYETQDYSAALTALQKGHELGFAQLPAIKNVADYHLALLLIRIGDFQRANELLSSQFVHSEVEDQVKMALGLGLLRVPLLPDEVDPSRDAVVAAAGSIAVQLARNQKSDAIAALQQAIRDYPDVLGFKAAYASVTQAGKEGTDPAELAQAARQFAGNTLRSGSDNSTPNTNFDELARKAQAAKDSGNVELATQTYVQALQVRPDWNEGWWDLSVLYFGSERYREAIAPLKKMVELKPGFGTAWALLGLSEYQTHDYKNALIHLEKAQGLGIQGSTEAVKIAQYHLGVLLSLNGEFDRAVELLSAGQPEGALKEQWNIALGLSLLRFPLRPDQVPAEKKDLYTNAGRAAALLATSKYDEAFAVFQKLLKEYPTTPFLHYSYGAALASLSQYDEARTQLKEEVKISADSALPFIRLAFIDLKVQESSEALNGARNAVRLAPLSAEARYVLGRALLATGDAAGAITELQTANEMMPNSPEIHFHLARAYSKAKQPDKAEDERATFARLNAIAERQRSLRGSQAYGASHEQQSDLALPAVQMASESPSVPQ